MLTSRCIYCYRLIYENDGRWILADHGRGACRHQPDLDRREWFEECYQIESIR